MPHMMKRNTVLSYWLRPATYPLPYQTLLMSVFITRAYNGFVTATVGKAYLCGLGGVAIGTAIGAYVFTHIPNRIFRFSANDR